MFEYIDAHSHPYFPEYDADREEEIAKMKAARIATVSIGVDMASSQASVRLAEEHNNIFASIGEHPGDLKAGHVFDSELVSLASHPKVVAIGECGLDYFRLDSSGEAIKAIQKDIFKAHIELALSVGKPLMLHIRPSDKINFDAYKDALDMLELYVRAGDQLRGNAHFFVGDMDVLQRFLAIGFAVSFGGVLSFARDYDAYVRAAPIDMILSETDAPFVAPLPYRGKRNTPLYIPEVVKAIASVRGEELEIVKKAMVSNASRLFGLPS